VLLLLDIAHLLPLAKQLGVAIPRRGLMILQHFPGLHRVKLLIRA